eukprot:361395-Lingulodinium_polyedra.AAC.1
MVTVQEVLDEALGKEADSREVRALWGGPSKNHGAFSSKVVFELWPILGPNMLAKATRKKRPPGGPRKTFDVP